MDTPADIISAQRTVIAAIKEVLAEERKRSDARLVALAEVLAVCRAARTGGEIVESEALERIAPIAREALR